jgi:transposase
VKYIQGQNRNQLVLFSQSLDMAIEAVNEVRTIDEFVNSLDLSDMGFGNMNITEEGRPAYHPSDLLKLYIYGYMNRTRSSRELEKETRRNIEVRWLIKGLTPDHNTIANFRRDNGDAIRKVFRATVEMAKFMKLIGGKIIAGDSVKLRAQNSKKNNYNKEKIERHMKYIDNKLEQYNKELEIADKDSDIERIKKSISRQTIHKEKYQRIGKQIEETGQLQVSTSDTDSRQLITRNNITEVAYNIQATTDAENKLILDYEVTNVNDTHAMGSMIEKAIAIVENNTFKTLFDKGYHTGIEIKKCHDAGIETLVAIPARSSVSQAPDHRFNSDYFTYSKEADTYTCPKGQILSTTGRWYSYPSKAYLFKQYRTKECKNCAVLNKCTKSGKRGRIVERTEFTENLERNKLYLEQNPELYKLRQAIVEHPFGTIKRQWGYDHTMMKRGIKCVSADIGLIFCAYNLRRMITILGKEGLRDLCFAFLFCFRRILRQNRTFSNIPETTKKHRRIFIQIKNAA